MREGFSTFFCIFVGHKLSAMRNNKLNESGKDYQTPSLRVIEASQETSFLLSNLEPIGGGDDPDIDW